MVPYSARNRRRDGLHESLGTEPLGQDLGGTGVSYREILDKCEALFRTDVLFNDKLIQIAKCFFDIKQLTLLKDGEIVGVVPVRKQRWGMILRAIYRL